MPNSNLATADIQTMFAKVGKGGELLLEHYDSNEFALLCNLLASEGKPGKVIKVTASTRIGEQNFVTCMRLALKAYYGDKPVGLGGVFVIRAGTAKLHCMVRLCSYNLRILICSIEPRADGSQTSPTRHLSQMTRWLSG